MDVVLLALILAITVEGLIEYVKSLYALAVEKDKKAFILQMGALFIGVLVAVSTGVDFYSWLGVVFAWPMIGSVFTGIFISRGSNYVSDFVGRLRGAKPTT